MYSKQALINEISEILNFDRDATAFFERPRTSKADDFWRMEWYAKALKINKLINGEKELVENTTITNIDQIKLSKNHTAIVHIDTVLSNSDKEKLEASFIIKFGCRVVVLDARQQAYFVENKPKAEKENKKQVSINKKTEVKPELLQLITVAGFTDRISGQLIDWVLYKKNKYEVKSFERLLKLVKNNIAEYGEIAVSDLIDVSMASMWQGICWDKLKNAKTATQNKQSDGGVYSLIDEAVAGLYDSK